MADEERDQVLELTDIEQRSEQAMLLLVALLQERNNRALADRLRAAHQRGIGASSTTDPVTFREAEEEFARVLADVRAFLMGERSGS
jgi:hypothetical protein